MKLKLFTQRKPSLLGKLILKGRVYRDPNQIGMFTNNPQLVLFPSKKNPNVKRWQRTGEPEQDNKKPQFTLGKKKEPDIKKEANEHKETFEKIKDDKIKSPEDLGKAIAEDHEEKQKPDKKPWEMVENFMTFNEFKDRIKVEIEENHPKNLDAWDKKIQEIKGNKNKNTVKLKISLNDKVLYENNAEPKQNINGIIKDQYEWNVLTPLIYGTSSEKAKSLIQRVIEGEISIKRAKEIIDTLPDKETMYEILEDNIQQALSEGKEVPEEVLKDYPELERQKSEKKEEKTQKELDKNVKDDYIDSQEKDNNSNKENGSDKMKLGDNLKLQWKEGDREIYASYSNIEGKNIKNNSSFNIPFSLFDALYDNVKSSEMINIIRKNKLDPDNYFEVKFNKKTPATPTGSMVLPKAIYAPIKEIVDYYRENKTELLKQKKEDEEKMFKVWKENDMHKAEIFLSSKGWGDYGGVVWSGDIRRSNESILKDMRNLLARKTDVDVNPSDEDLLKKIEEKRKEITKEVNDYKEENKKLENLKNTFNMEVLASDKGTPGEGGRDPYAKVKLTNKDTGESVDLIARNIFDFGFVINKPEGGMLDIQNKTWSVWDEKKSGWNEKPATDLEVQAGKYLTHFSPIGTGIRM